MSDLKITHLFKRYGNVEILKDVNLDIKSGEFIVFVGPSGCGKSTLLRCISGLETISAGTLEIDGRVVNDVAPSKRGIAMVFQSYALYPHMTVYDNMAYALKLQNLSKAEHRPESTRRCRKAAAHAISSASAQGAVRRAAPARRYRPRHRPRSAGLPVRRAALQPRRGAPRPDAHRDQPAQGAAA